MASSEILSNYSASRHYITLTFKSSIQVSTLSTDDFTFETIAATPQEIPFKNINLDDDYDSIRRKLVLYFVELPPYSGDYHLTISGLRTASGYDYATETLVVPYSFDNAPFDEPESPDDFVDIEDKSIREDLFKVVDADSGTSKLAPVSVDPETNDGLIFEDYAAGVITVRFSKRPNIGFVNQNYIKVQKKKIMNGYSRWENIDNAIFSLDGNFHTVYIYMPSNDSTPVYGAHEREYFESGYKYRVRFSPNFAANA